MLKFLYNDVEYEVDKVSLVKFIEDKRATASGFNMEIEEDKKESSKISRLRDEEGSDDPRPGEKKSGFELDKLRSKGEDAVFSNMVSTSSDAYKTSTELHTELHGVIGVPTEDYEQTILSVNIEDKPTYAEEENEEDVSTTIEHNVYAVPLIASPDDSHTTTPLRSPFFQDILTSPRKTLDNVATKSSPEAKGTPGSMGSGSTTFEATFAPNILISYRPSDKGKNILIIINRKRAKTRLGDRQGDHTTAYVSLLEMIFSLIDRENKKNASNLLIKAAQCFMDEEESNKFKDYLKNEIKSCEEELFSTEVIADVASYKAEYKDIILKGFKRSNRELFSTLLVKTASYVLEKMNQDKLAVLPRLRKSKKTDPLISDLESTESDTVKKAIKKLRFLNKFAALQKRLETGSEENYARIIQDFEDDFKRIMKFSQYNIEKDLAYIRNFKGFLEEIYKEDFTKWEKKISVASLIVANTTHIKNLKLDPIAVGALFNDLYDFDEKNIRKAELEEIDAAIEKIQEKKKKKKNYIEAATQEEIEELLNGTIGHDAKIIFLDLAETLYQVSARHLNLMFIAFRYIGATEEEKNNIINEFLDKVLIEQGWIKLDIEPEMIEEDLVKLDRSRFYEKIVPYLNSFKELLPIAPLIEIPKDETGISRSLKC